MFATNTFQFIVLFVILNKTRSVFSNRYSDGFRVNFTLYYAISLTCEWNLLIENQYRTQCADVIEANRHPIKYIQPLDTVCMNFGTPNYTIFFLKYYVCNVSRGLYIHKEFTEVKLSNLHNLYQCRFKIMWFLTKAIFKMSMWKIRKNSVLSWKTLFVFI